MTSQNRIGLFGGGKMGRALIQGMVRAGEVAEVNVRVREPSEECRRWWKINLPSCFLSDDPVATIQDSNLVIIAVKPDTVSLVAEEVANDLRDQVVISIAAGIRLSNLQQMFRSGRVVRVMPNTPAIVGEGVSAFTCGPDIKGTDVAAVERLLGSIGLAISVPEKWMDGVTGLSGSGPAMACLMIEGLADGGVLAGLPREFAMKLAAQTLLGTAKMILQEGTHPAVLKDQVASPAGTTIAALEVLEQRGLRGALMSAVKRAADRSREMG